MKWIERAIFFYQRVVDWKMFAHSMETPFNFRLIFLNQGFYVGICYKCSDIFTVNNGHGCTRKLTRFIRKLKSCIRKLGGEYTETTGMII